MHDGDYGGSCKSQKQKNQYISNVDYRNVSPTTVCKRLLKNNKTLQSARGNVTGAVHVSFTNTDCTVQWAESTSLRSFLLLSSIKQLQYVRIMYSYVQPDKFNQASQLFTLDLKVKHK